MGGKMTFQATVYRILIAAPNDVIAEQKEIQDGITSWNTQYSAKMMASQKLTRRFPPGTMLGPDRPEGGWRLIEAGA
ncbi:MAG: hypothetical protein WBN64_12735, partial [Candidatus Deferrimicrobium sp.]